MLSVSHIRGQVKRLLNHDDYCMDLDYARKNGIEVNHEVMGVCR